MLRLSLHLVLWGYGVIASKHMTRYTLGILDTYVLLCCSYAERNGFYLLVYSGFFLDIYSVLQTFLVALRDMLASFNAKLY